MLAIIETMEHYPHYIEGLGQQTIVFSDHKSLLWFTETKVYNRRQVRWVEKLSTFDFKIIFWPGKQSGKPDASSHRSDYTLGKDASECTMTFLKLKQVDTSLLESEDPIPTIYHLHTVDLTPVTQEDDHIQAIHPALDQDPEVGPYLPQIRNLTSPRSTENASFLQLFFTNVQERVLHNGRVYVPAVGQIKVDIIQEHYDAKIVGHLGQEKTLELLAWNYYWPRI
jgi:hypothetical protein